MCLNMFEALKAILKLCQVAGRKTHDSTFCEPPLGLARFAASSCEAGGSCRCHAMELHKAKGILFETL